MHKSYSLFTDQADVEGITDSAHSKQIGTALSLDAPVNVIANGIFDSCFAVSALAASSIGAVGSAMASLVQSTGLCPNLPRVHVDQRLASLWFAQSIYPIGWSLPPIWDSLAGDYQTKDGWIKLHTNLAHHREASLRVLGCAANRDKAETAVLRWKSDDLESEIVSRGGVAAAMRSRQDWECHPQGSAIASEPLVMWSKPRVAKLRFSPGSHQRPLEGLRVLDLTRVLAGPVATRTLAGFGADVLRIDPPGWDEPFVVPDITLGKRCTYLDLECLEDRQVFEMLLKNADVLVHGYRPGALDGLGYGQATRQSLSTNLIEVSLNAYGWTGPWANRRGFDSLVQMSCGIADAGMHWAESKKPTPLPVQALDHATGYLMAAAVIRLITIALNRGRVGSASLSLARTSELLTNHRQSTGRKLNAEPRLTDVLEEVEVTPWGNANRLRPALNIQGTAMEWSKSANDLGSSAAHWLKY